jgi:hypothetical protein
MKKIIFRALFGIILCISITCNAESGRIKVASQGVTDIATAFGKTKVAVQITTHEMDIGKASDKWPQKRLSSCTYSRFPCSLVDYMEITVDDNDLLVVRSVYADLADLGVASLREKKKGHFVLTLVGGDASESYTVEVTFDR